MHEMSLAMNIIDLASSRAREAGADHVRGVELEVGSMAGVMVDSLRFCFEAASRNTPAEGAALTIQTIEASGQCTACSACFPVHTMTDGCPECGEMLVHISGGRELKIISITIDD